MPEVPAFTLPNGKIVKLGYRRRAFEPASVKYNFSNYERAATVDLTQPRVYWGSGPDPRLPILDQKQIGSCVSFGVPDGATEAERMAGAAAVELMHNYGYWWARVKEGTFPQDAGSDPADMLELCIAGMPPQSAQPGGYVDNAAESFAQYAPQATLKYVASFHAMYPTDAPNLQTLIWQALDAGYPVNIAMIWTQAFFTPSQGKLPGGQTPAQEVGGHDFECWGIVPGFFLCSNQWGTGWAADAPQSGFPNMRPGDFAVPWEYGAPRSLIDAAYAIVGVSVPGPKPKPTPQPNPPVVTLAPAWSGTAGQSLAFTATTDAAQPSFAWNFGDGQTGTGEPISHTYSAQGPYTLTLLVTDRATGLSAGATAAVQIVAAPTPPSVSLNGPWTGVVGQPVNITASYSNVKTPRLSIDYGDGTAPGIDSAHTYTQPGLYAVRATVTDLETGAFAVAKAIATITAAPPPNLAAPLFAYLGQVMPDIITRQDVPGLLVVAAGLDAWTPYLRTLAPPIAATFPSLRSLKRSAS